MSIKDEPSGASTIPVTRFKRDCLLLIRSMGARGRPLTITKNGRPVAVLSPWKPRSKKSSMGMLAGTILVEGDIVSPIDEPWEVDG